MNGKAVTKGKNGLRHIIKDQEYQGNLSDRKIIPVFVGLDPLPYSQEKQPQNKTKAFRFVFSIAEMVLFHDLRDRRLFFGSFIFLRLGGLPDKIQERGKHQKGSKRIESRRIVDKIQRETIVLP